MLKKLKEEKVTETYRSVNEVRKEKFLKYRILVADILNPDEYYDYQEELEELKEAQEKRKNRKSKGKKK